MRLATLWHEGAARLASPLEDGFVDIQKAHAAYVAWQRVGTSVDPRTLGGIVDVLAAGEPALSAARAGFEFVAGLDEEGRWRSGAWISNQMTYLPAVPNPHRFLCVGRNYLEHAKEAGKVKNDVPILFVRFPSSLVGNGQPMIRPIASEQLDWEVELAVVIGKPCRHVKKKDALSVVGGYAVFNDGSVRDYQIQGVQWTAGKNFFHTGPFGPWVTTADEIPDPQTLQLTTRVNGHEVQNSNTSKMIFDVATLIEHITTWTPLNPGDVIATGTPEGVGLARKPQWWLKAGDVVTTAIDKLGVLENVVADEEPAST